MRIRFEPKAGGQHRVTIPSFPAGPITDPAGNPTGAEYRTWTAGEERDVPDDLRVRFNVSNNAFALREGRVIPGATAGAAREVRAVDALLSVGPMFVDATTGKNPDFTCSECGEETTELYFHDPGLATPGVDIDHDRGPETRVWYSTTGTIDGDKLCQQCFLSRNPQYIALHEDIGAPRAVTSEARRRSDDARIKAEQNKRAQVQAQVAAPQRDVAAATRPAQTQEDSTDAR